VATGSYEHSALRLWDPETGQEQHALPGPQGAIDFLSFSADGSSVLVGSKDHTLRCWDWTHGKEATVLSWDAGLVTDDLAISPAGPVKAAFYHEFEPQERALRIWGPLPHAKPRLLAKNVDLVCIALSPDGRHLLGVTQTTQQPGSTGAHKSRTIRLWDVDAGKEVAKNAALDAEVSGLAYSPDGTTFVTAHAKEGLRFWDARTLQELRRLPGNADVDTIVFSPDGKLVAGVNKKVFGRPARLWEIATGKERSLPIKNSRALTFSPDGKLLGVGTSDPESALVFIDVAKGKEIRRLKGHHSGVLSVAFSPSNRFVATGGGDSTVLLWKLTGSSTLTAGESKTPPAADPLTDSTKALVSKKPSTF
jgi:WD40 repeat protein